MRPFNSKGAHRQIALTGQWSASTSKSFKFSHDTTVSLPCDETCIAF